MRLSSLNFFFFLKKFFIWKRTNNKGKKEKLNGLHLLRISWHRLANYYYLRSKMLCMRNYNAYPRDTSDKAHNKLNVLFFLSMREFVFMNLNVVITSSLNLSFFFVLSYNCIISMSLMTIKHEFCTFYVILNEFINSMFYQILQRNCSSFKFNWILTMNDTLNWHHV